MPSPARSLRWLIAAAAAPLLVTALPAHSATPRLKPAQELTRAPHFLLPAQADSETCRAACGKFDATYFDVVPLGELTKDGTADIDGDGGEDVVSVDSEATYVNLEFRRGVNGARLLALHLDQPLYDIFPARVGSTARPGVVVVTDGSTYAQRNVFGQTLIMSTYDGRTGRLLWKRAYSAQLDGVSDPAGAAALEDVLPRKTGVTSFLLSYELPVHFTSYVQPVVVSGATGAATLSGTKLAVGKTKLGDVAMHGIGDLDADGLTDYGVTAHQSFQARSAASGAPLWSLARGPNNFLGVPDTNGDGVGDVIVQPTLYDGKTGAARFAVSGTEQRAAGDVNADGRTDLLDITQPSDHKSMRVRLYDGASGRVDWTRWLVVNGTWDYTWADQIPIRDIDGDGTPDLGVSYGGWNTHGHSVSHYQWLIGRDGALGAPRVTQATALLSSYDGAGDDFSTGSAVNGVSQATVLDGRDAHPLITVATGPIGFWGSRVDLGNFVANSAGGFLTVAYDGEYHGGAVTVRVFNHAGSMLWTVSGSFFVP